MSAEKARGGTAASFALRVKPPCTCPGMAHAIAALYPEPPPPGEVPSCAEGGVLGVLPGIIGLVQATEVVKLLLGQGTSLGREGNALRCSGDEIP